MHHHARSALQRLEDRDRKAAVRRATASLDRTPLRRCSAGPGGAGCPPREAKTPPHVARSIGTPCALEMQASMRPQTNPTPHPAVPLSLAAGAVRLARGPFAETLLFRRQLIRCEAWFEPIEAARRLLVPRAGGNPIPVVGFEQVLVDAEALLVEEREVELAVEEAARGGLVEPVGRSLIVARATWAAQVQHREVVHGLGHAL